MRDAQSTFPCTKSSGCRSLRLLVEFFQSIVLVGPARSQYLIDRDLACPVRL